MSKEPWLLKTTIPLGRTGVIQIYDAAHQDHIILRTSSGSAANNWFVALNRDEISKLVHHLLDLRSRLPEGDHGK